MWLPKQRVANVTGPAPPYSLGPLCSLFRARWSPPPSSRCLGDIKVRLDALCCAMRAVYTSHYTRKGRTQAINTPTSSAPRGNQTMRGWGRARVIVATCNGTQQLEFRVCALGCGFALRGRGEHIVNWKSHTRLQSTSDNLITQQMEIRPAECPPPAL